ncbi:hypothetical protein Q7P37_002294 [Cladosporium fusiforme]
MQDTELPRAPETLLRLISVGYIRAVRPKIARKLRKVPIVDRQVRIRSMSVQDLVEEVALAFRTSIAIASASPPDISSPSDVQDLEELSDRFVIWSSNVDLITNRSKVFEQRLHQSSSELQATVTELLRDIKGDLAEGKEATHGRSKVQELTSYLAQHICAAERSQAKGQELTDAISDPDHTPTTSDLQGADQSQGDTVRMLVEDIGEAVECLMRLSDSLVERLGGVDSVTRQYSSSDMQIHPEVLKRFPRANHGILERLTNSINDRQNEILTMIRQQKALKQQADDKLTLEQIANNIKPVLREQSHGAKIDWENSGDDTTISSVTSDGIDLQQTYECSLCRNEVSCNKLSTLRKHYLQDLAPYICLSESCPRPSRRYMSRSTWTDHIRVSHGRVWRCCFGCSETFKSMGDFEAHMEAEHGPKFSPEEIAGLADMCEKHVLPEDTNCPLCLASVYPARSMFRHISRHLEELILLSFASPGCTHTQGGKESIGSKKMDTALHGVRDNETRKADDPKKVDGPGQAASSTAPASVAKRIFERSYGSNRGAPSTASSSFAGRGSTTSYSSSRGAPSTAATSLLERSSMYSQEESYGSGRAGPPVAPDSVGKSNDNNNANIPEEPEHLPASGPSEVPIVPRPPPRRAESDQFMSYTGPPVNERPKDLWQSNDVWQSSSSSSSSVEPPRIDRQLPAYREPVYKAERRYFPQRRAQFRSPVTQDYRYSELRYGDERQYHLSRKEVQMPSKMQGYRYCDSDSFDMIN